MPQEITLYDLAKALNLTPATVSRALNDSHEISEKTKERVRKLAKEWNYQPNRMASGLRSNRNKMVGVVIPNVSYFFNSTAIAGIEDILGNKGYRIIICQSKEKLDQETEILKDLASIRVDGMIVSLSAESKNIEHFNRYILPATPIVFLDRIPDETPHVRVYIDNSKSVYDAIKYLISTGRKRIAWAGGPEELCISEKRYEGYCRAHREAGLSIDPSLKIHFPFEYQHCYQRFRDLLLNDPGVDAVFAVNDRLAIEVYAAVRDTGKTIPEDITIMGFNDEPFSSLLNPSLSTIYQPAYDMGREAARQLLNQINRKRLLKKDFVFETSIIKRNSTY